jgi:hypothetical protein
MLLSTGGSGSFPLKFEVLVIENDVCESLFVHGSIEIRIDDRASHRSNLQSN